MWKKHILNKFDVFTSILCTPKDVLPAQKFYALLNRARKKGRDFYDIIFLMRDTQPNFRYLEEKMNIKNGKELKERLDTELKDTDLKAMAEDVKPFLFRSDEVKKILLFKEYINREIN